MVRVFTLSTLYNPDIASASLWTLISPECFAKKEFLSMKIFTGTLFECIMIIVSISCFKSVLNIQSDSQVQKIEKDIPWIILKKAYALDSF